MIKIWKIRDSDINQKIESKMSNKLNQLTTMPKLQEKKIMIKIKKIKDKNTNQKVRILNRMIKEENINKKILI